MKRAVVVGSAGQDGRILCERLSADHDVVGIDLGGVDVTVAQQIDALIARVAPDALYYLAARHHSSEERPDEAEELRTCLGVHVSGLVNVLDSLRRRAPACRVFYAGSSHMFGRPDTRTQNEMTPFAPLNPYGITKVAGAHVCALYRKREGMHVSVGILYNHESPYRGPHFVTQKIVQGARRAAKDRSYTMRVGSLSAVVDWGYAPDYVDAMMRIVAQPSPDDYVVATGVPHTVQDFSAAAFGAVGLDWRNHVSEDPLIVTGEPSTLIGDATKLRTATGWAPSVTFEAMVDILVNSTK